MALGKNQLSISVNQSNKFQIYSALPVILDDVIQLDRVTEIKGDTVLVKGRVVTKGFGLTIACRVLIFEEGGCIDTTGRIGDNNFEPNLRPETAHIPGASGIDGRSGSSGHPGGAVQIVAHTIVGIPSITTQGGKGGRPEDGGHGRNGQQGADGKRFQSEYAKGNIHGDNGGQGGACGLPGYRQAGGDGGNITIYTQSGRLSDHALLNSNPGQASDMGDSGNPGKGGLGGQPGAWEVLECWIDPRFTLASHGKGYILDEDVITAEENKIPFEEYLLHSAQLYDELDSSTTKLGLPSYNIQTPPLVSAAIGTFAPPIDRPGPGGRKVCSVEKTIQGAAGLSGADGSRREEELAIRNAEPKLGQAGVIAIKEIDTQIISIYDDITLELLTYALEDDYRKSGNSPDQKLLDRVNFLITITTLDSPSAIRSEVLARAYAMARKINLGYDFYGYTRERVPLLSFETYSLLINEMVIPQANIVEKAFEKYWQDFSDIEQQRSSLQLAREGAAKRKGGLDIAYDGAKGDLQQQLKELPALDNRVASAYQHLIDAKADLDGAIKKKNGNKCGLVNTLSTVAVIVAGVSTGGAALIGTASAATKLFKDIGDNDASVAQLWDSRKLIGDDLKEVGKEASTVAQSVEAINKAYSELNEEQRKLPQFRMEREQFDKVAKDFADIPEAEAYREAGYDYLKCVETRNQAIVDYNAGLVQLIELRTQINSADRIIDGIESALNSKTDPGAPYLRNIMSRLYMDTLALAAQFVHAEKKALAYHFARPADAPVSALNLSTIIGAHQRTVLVDWREAKERWQAKRNLKEGALKLDLQKFVSKEAWEAFKRTRVLGFTIRFDHPFYNPRFEYLLGLRLTGLSLRLVGAKTASGQDYIPLRLTHQGNEAIYLADGSVNYFSHRAVTFSGFSHTSVDDHEILESDFSENGLYAGVSPFSAWILRLSDNPNLKLDLESLESATLNLSGFMLEGTSSKQLPRDIVEM